MNLGKLVIKYLAVLATSAPSERIWSRAARVLNVKRNRMKEDVTAATKKLRQQNTRRAKLVPQSTTDKYIVLVMRFHSAILLAALAIAKGLILYK